MRCSWLIPVRNGAPWLAGAVQSALDQCGEQDEVVVVDDGSHDGSVSTLNPHPRLRSFRQAAKGLVTALELGRSRCRGRFVARLDADDLARPGRLDCQVAALEADPGLAAVGGRAALFVDRGPPPRGMHHYVSWINGLDDLHRELLVESPLLHPAVTFRAAAVTTAGGYREGDMPEDYDLWLRLVAGGHRIASVKQEVVAIRDHPGRLTRTDPRYQRSGFDLCRRNFLQVTVLREPRKVVLWAGQRGGRPWLQWLKYSGHRVVAVLDITSAKERNRTPVLPPTALAELDFDLLLVAVGTRGARQKIRREIARLRPDLTEGRDWWALL